jgi:hypothetical protein
MCGHHLIPTRIAFHLLPTCITYPCVWTSTSCVSVSVSVSVSVVQVVHRYRVTTKQEDRKIIVYDMFYQKLDMHTFLLFYFLLLIPPLLSMVNSGTTTMFNLPWLFDRFCLDWPRSKNVDFLLALATLFSLCFSIDRFHTGLDIFHLVPFLSPTPHCPRTPCTTTEPTKNKLVCQCTDRQRKKTTTKRTNKQTTTTKRAKQNHHHNHHHHLQRTK